ncbi:Receptor-like protein 12 [Vitis vinifera]|uniref:Receptor-like protein 12 n=1 Tax=Vitis vinifera TaxID=29760 RepID=A0A438GS03_VITVI|nr:Receptor-like protein 12 [Vitis vinifera]
MMSKLLLCFLFFLSSSQLLSSSFSFSNSTKLCPHQQALALLHLKQSFSIDNSSSWDCDSNGITSYPKTEPYNWAGPQLQQALWHHPFQHNPFPPSSSTKAQPGFQQLQWVLYFSWVWSVLKLTHFNLSYSGFSGLIAPEISHLSTLVSLDLSENYGAEFAPHGFNSLVQNLTKLQKLHLRDLSGCGLHGRFPDHDIHLPKLEVLDLWRNDDLSGNFPRFSENNSLMELDLSFTNLSGELPASIDFGSLRLRILRVHSYFNGNLKSLQTLDLSDCEFSGSIPTSIGNLKSLQTLDLSNCEFLGSIPTSIGNLKSLRSLYLFSNNFSGQLPPSIGNLTNLQNLRFSNNLFNGTIPSQLYTLPSLVNLDLSHKKLTGHIGEFQFDSLEYIDLSMNELHGPIPSSIFKLANLEFLYLYSNNLSGVLETSNFGKLRNLTLLVLSNNMLSLITSGNSNSILPYIERLDLSNNKISGIWSWNMGKDTLLYLNLSYNIISGFEMLPWKNMHILDLHSNLLQGPLPIPPNSTFFFSVSHNKLSGEISPLICKVSSMGVLDLSSNNLSGMLPHCLGNFSKDLSVLNLRRNRFHGTIPQTFLKGNAIRNLDFNDNQLEGLVPRSLIIYRKLEVLDLGNNKINDTFPHWLRTLPELQVLVLRSNSFHGHIGFSKIKSPFMSLRIIDLAHNDFEGDLPEMYLRSLKAIMNIDEGNMARKYMGEYYYQDSITVTTKGLDVELVKILNTFTTVDLSSNKFQGEIPKSIGNLNSLRGLNLSHNNLTGLIPSSFGNLKSLESLDLSSNELIGSIPQQLTSLTFLEVLNLSQNHLTGFIPRGNQFDTFGNDSYNENSGLCGFPLSKKCIADETPEPSKEADAKFDGGFDWKITLMGYGCGLVIGLSLGCLVFLTGKPKWFVGLLKIIFIKRSEGLK